MHKTAKILLLILSFMMLTACSKNVYSISIPEPSQIISIELTEGGKKSVISDTMGINRITDALKSADNQTKNQSIQDYPVNAEDLIGINMALENGSAFSVYIYEKNDRYYMEQPYNGIYKMKEKYYDIIEDFVD